MPLKGSKSPHSKSLANRNIHSRTGGFARNYHLFFVNNNTNLTLPIVLVDQLDGWYPNAPLMLSVIEHQLSIKLAVKDGNSRIRVYGTSLVCQIPEDVLTHLGWRQVEEISIKLDAQGGGLRANLVRQRGRRYSVTITRNEFLELIMCHPKVPQALRDQHITESSVFNGRTWDLLLPEVSFTFEVERDDGNQPIPRVGPPDTKHLHMSDPEHGITVEGHEDEFDLTKLQKYIDEVPEDGEPTS